MKATVPAPTPAGQPARRTLPVRPEAGFPRAPLYAAAALVLVMLLTVTFVRVTGVGVVHVADAPAVEVREFRFEDRPDGSIVVLNLRNQVVETVAPGSNGFLRGTMRGLVRERKRQGIGPEIPFRMIGHADGRLTLEDPGTGRRVDLGSFGPTNSAVFARLMDPPPTAMNK
jgi:putative photosynthetic complex assembly protein